MVQHHPTREAWLEAAIEQLRPWLEGLDGHELPARVRVSVGFPSRGGMSEKSQRIGECWDVKCTSDKSATVFVSPLLDEIVGKRGVLPTLVHELVHAAVGCECGHRGQFRRMAKLAGLDGPMRATVAGDELEERLNALSRKLGEFPHATLNPLKRSKKKQTTRLLKFQCPACGWTGRTTAKWLEEGLPTCHCGSECVVDMEVAPPRVSGVDPDLLD